MLPQKIFKIRIFILAENEFQTTKFPDFSLTFGILSQILWLFKQIPWLLQVFQVSGNPVLALTWALTCNENTANLASTIVKISFIEVEG